MASWVDPGGEAKTEPWAAFFSSFFFCASFWISPCQCQAVAFSKAAPSDAFCPRWDTKGETGPSVLGDVTVWGCACKDECYGYRFCCLPLLLPKEKATVEFQVGQTCILRFHFFFFHVVTGSTDQRKKWKKDCEQFAVDQRQQDVFQPRPCCSISSDRCLLTGKKN